jgi:hypothetical protein
VGDYPSKNGLPSERPQRKVEPSVHQGHVMARSKRPNKHQRFKRLLEAGFFPSELPPPFVSFDLARFREHLSKVWPAGPLSQFVSEPEQYSIPRFGRARRRLSIINPINHFKVSKLMAEEWKEIRDFLRHSEISEFKPIFDLEGPRTFFGLSFSTIERRGCSNPICIQIKR